MVIETELLTFVIYDIVSDRLRLRIANVCKDFGLDHLQYSVFSGPLDRTRRAELFARLDGTLGSNEGRILMLSLCEKDTREKREIIRTPDDADHGDR